jgi:hypothetical protein
MNQRYAMRRKAAKRLRGSRGGCRVLAEGQHGIRKLLALQNHQLVALPQRQERSRRARAPQVVHSAGPSAAAPVEPSNNTAVADSDSVVDLVSSDDEAAVSTASEVAKAPSPMPTDRCVYASKGSAGRTNHLTVN